MVVCLFVRVTEEGGEAGCHTYGTTQSVREILIYIHNGGLSECFHYICPKPVLVK